MISGMRARRRGAFKAGAAYKFYRLWVTASDGGATRIAEFNLVTVDNPGGVPSGGTPDANAGLISVDNAFDGSPSSLWTVLKTEQALPHWISYEFPTPQKVTMYRIQVRATASEATRTAPTAWLFEGSHDGVDWDVLDTQSGLTWTIGEIKEFPL
ncbi:MAG TPA: discoidin domain-containing protein [Beutenbergiaceae bacterium]|nr:discoidin domain-containing protein [Beutenbergiaceae bacterium]